MSIKFYECVATVINRGIIPDRLILIILCNPACLSIEFIFEVSSRKGHPRETTRRKYNKTNYQLIQSRQFDVYILLLP